MTNKILIIGSSNTDMVVKTKAFPSPGETVLGGTFLMNPGGKGANQAVAAARLGADVRFVTKTGNDIFGTQSREGFLKEKINIDFSPVTTKFPSGVALITVNEHGENTITVASGANMDLNPEDLPDVVFEDIRLVLVQFEIPLETVAYIVEKCKEKQINVIINPAPAAKPDQDILKDLYLITPNETETEIITGIKPIDERSTREAAIALQRFGVKNVIITLGKKGVYLYTDKYDEFLPAVVVEAVDTTAAGDVFNGALTTSLASGQDIKLACEYACRAAAISVTREGAQASAPYLHEM